MCEENMVAVDSNANMVQCWIPSEAGEVGATMTFPFRGVTDIFKRHLLYSGKTMEARSTRVPISGWMAFLFQADFCLGMGWPQGKVSEQVRRHSPHSCSPRSRIQVGALAHMLNCG